MLKLILITLLLTGCSTMHILKECHPVDGLNETYVCKNLKPWE